MSDNDKLKPHRAAIDQIDAEILQLLNRRASHAQAIGNIKGDQLIYRPEREAAVLRRVQQFNPGPLSNHAVARLQRAIMSECLALERPLTIAYLGPQGTFTEQAAVKHFGQAAQTQPCSTIDEAFRLVEANQADYVVTPVENSTEGSIGRSLDLLVKTPLKACGEVILRIHHHLLRASAEQQDFDKVYAHAQALAQCRNWLDKNLPKQVARIAVASNAEAARMAAADNSAVAIASMMAAKHYQLYALASNIEDEPNNTTRFLVLGYNETTASGRDKTSLIVAVPNKAGAVHQLLLPFAEHGVSMSKLESRPSRGGLWEYVFFIDVEGHQQDSALSAALNDLQQCSAFLKLIGSYPQAIM
ncbi:MAG: prephenate dehydratase [Snodgrassella sp.]|jgi:chorismate mutase / prephenate dehydratase|nr:prephenate dehydratase [Snodgrassella sp.]